MGFQFKKRGRGFCEEVNEIMGTVEDLKKELAGLKAKKMNDDEIKKLKSQIKAHKFGATRGGKIFNKIADIGDAGFKATGKFLSEQPQPSGKKRKKPVSVEEVMKRLPQ